MADDREQTNGGATVRNLDNIALLTDLPPQAMRDLERTCTWQKFEPDQVILTAEENSVDLLFIATGGVHILQYLRDGHEVAIADLEAGSFFGELSAIDNRGRSARVVSDGHSVIASLSREEFLATLRKFPGVALRLMDHLVAVIRTTTGRMSSFAKQTPRQRVYAELLRLAEPNSAGDGNWIIEPVPMHRDIAGWAGTERDLVANAIGSLVRDGVVRRKNKTLLINDYAKLRMLAEM